MRHPASYTDADALKNYVLRVEGELSRLTGGEIDDVDDLPDFDYSAYFEDGVRPADAAQDAIDAAGGF